MGTRAEGRPVTGRQPKTDRWLARVMIAVGVCVLAGTGERATAQQSASRNEPQAGQPLAFPGAQGWAAHTRGGRGGKILRVTTLAAKGPGSFLEALETAGPRVIVFEVGGVIDLHGQEIDIREPFLTIAGQTAPHPGITLIRAGVNIRTHDVIIRHIRVRMGTAGMAKGTGWEPDAMGTVGAYNVIVDHCSLTW